jgi:hypothetical protein
MQWLKRAKGNAESTIQTYQQVGNGNEPVASGVAGDKTPAFNLSQRYAIREQLKNRVKS